MLAVVTFVPQEARALSRLLRSPRVERRGRLRFTTGELDGVPTVIVLAGMGAGCEAGVAALLDRHPVRAVAACGVAAAVDPSLRIGEVILADVVLSASGERFEPHLTPDLAAPTGARRGGLVTVPIVLVSESDKRAVEGGSAADMETALVARVAARARLPWCALRAVSDTAAESLPLDFNRYLDAEGQLRLPLLLRALAAQPTALPALLRLGRNTTRACAALAKAAASFLPGWYREVVG